MALFGRWQTKPPPGTQLDWTHPLTRGLVGCWPMNEGCGSVAHNMAPSANVNHGTLTGAGGVLPTWTSSKYGSAITTVAASSQYINCGNIAELNGAFQATLMVFGQPSGASYYLVGRSVSIARLFRIDVTAGTAFLVSQTGVTNPHCTTVAGATDWAMVYDSTLSGWPEIKGYISGLPQTLATGGTIPGQGVALPTTTTDTFRIGTEQADSLFVDGCHDLALLWCGRALQAGEIASLHSNPWQIFAPPAPYWMAKRTFPCWLNYDEDR